MARSVLGCLLWAARWIVFLGFLVAAGIYLWQPGASPKTKGEPMEAVFLRTRDDSDAIVLKQGEACVVIDTGEDEDAETILSLLAEKGVSEIDLMVLSHPDADHIGGARRILASIPVKRIVMPYYDKENARLAELETTIGEKGTPVVCPTRTRRFSAGEMKLLVYPPLEKYYKRDNNYSLAVLASHGTVNLVLPGDAEEKRIRELMEINWPKTALYKAPHHGRASPLSESFIRKLSPDFIVVTASGSDEAVRSAGEAAGARISYTGGGTVVFKSDGTTLTFESQE